MKKITMKCTFLALAIVTAFNSDGNAATINASSCSNTDIQAAITSASSGDTVTVPAGNCTWTGKVIIPEVKTIKLIGAGLSNTIISYSNPMILSLSPNSRISGFRFNLTGGGSPPMVEMRNIGFRVDNNYFDNQTGLSREAVIASGTNLSMEPEGVVDNNVLVECRFGSYGEGNYNFRTDHSSNIVWAAANNFGSAGSGWVYFEDNTITRSSGNAMDANHGGKFVFRYNDVTGVSVMAHSIQGPDHRGTKAWEVYGNTFTFNAVDEGNFIGFMRGGTGRFFGNYTVGPATGYQITLDNVRSAGCNDGACGSNPPPATDDSGVCNGTSLWDGNDLANGWPCRDQIGRGPDTGTDSSIIGKATSSSPLYLWSNWRSNAVITPAYVVDSGDNRLHIQNNRDYYDYVSSFNGSSGTGCGTLASRPSSCSTGVGYWATDQSCSDLTGMVGVDPTIPISGTLYQCVSTDTWIVSYTPYTYPHPLSMVDASPNVMVPSPSSISPPQNFKTGN